MSALHSDDFMILNHDDSVFSDAFYAFVSIFSSVWRWFCFHLYQFLSATNSNIPGLGMQTNLKHISCLTPSFLCCVPHHSDWPSTAVTPFSLFGLHHANLVRPIRSDPYNFLRCTGISGCQDTACNTHGQIAFFLRSHSMSDLKQTSQSIKFLTKSWL